jgi:hypothetical protein
MPPAATGIQVMVTGVPACNAVPVTVTGRAIVVRCVMPLYSKSSALGAEKTRATRAAAKTDCRDGVPGFYWPLFREKPLCGE